MMSKRIKMVGLLMACCVAVCNAGTMGDYNDLQPVYSSSYPGGWNFDIVGVRMLRHGSSSRHHLSRFGLFNGWGFGVTGALSTPAGSNMYMMRSFNFCIEDMLAYRIHVGKRGDFSIGMGIELRNYRQTGRARFAMDPLNRTISIDGYPEGTTAGTSRIRTFSTTYNLKYVHYLGEGFRLAVGPELTVVRKPGKKHEIRTKYADADGFHKERIRGINTNKIGLNLVGIVSYKNKLGFYTKYSPTSVLENGYGPQFQSITAGVMILGL